MNQIQILKEQILSLTSSKRNTMKWCLLVATILFILAIYTALTYGSKYICIGYILLSFTILLYANSLKKEINKIAKAQASQFFLSVVSMATEGLVIEDPEFDLVSLMRTVKKGLRLHNAAYFTLLGDLRCNWTLSLNNLCISGLRVEMSEVKYVFLSVNIIEKDSPEHAVPENTIGVCFERAKKWYTDTNTTMKYVGMEIITEFPLRTYILKPGQIGLEEETPHNFK